MNWFQRIAQQPTVLWHATTAELAEKIDESGEIVPSLDLESETGENYTGWGFQQKGQQYGEGVYLATTAEKAIYYASIRLRWEWDAIENADDYYLDENFKFIGLFRVYITNTTKLVPVNSQFRYRSINDADEFMYLGRIFNQPNIEAWFDGPKWVSRSRDLQQHQNRSEEIAKEFYEHFTNT